MMNKQLDYSGSVFYQLLYKQQNGEYKFYIQTYYLFFWLMPISSWIARCCLAGLYQYCYDDAITQLAMQQMNTALKIIMQQYCDVEIYFFSILKFETTMQIKVFNSKIFFFIFREKEY